MQSIKKWKDVKMMVEQREFTRFMAPAVCYLPVYNSVIMKKLQP